MELDLAPVQEIYDKARFLLIEFGEKDGGLVVFKHQRIELRGSTDSAMLTIWFDDRENTGESYPSTAMTVDSTGKLRDYSEPHLSEKEAKEGQKRSDAYIPWTSWLDDAYREGKRRQEVASQQLAL